MRINELRYYNANDWHWKDMKNKEFKARKPQPEDFGDTSQYEEYLDSWEAENKERETHFTPKAEQVIQSIQSKCQPYLQQNPKLIPMFRGSQFNGTDVFEKPIRTDRFTKDTGPKWTNFWDEGLAQRGIKANRRNSAFCTGDRRVAEMYGHPFVVFPLGEFNYSWHPYVRDLYRSITDYTNHPTQDFSIAKFLTKALTEVQADDGSLVHAIHSENEILIHTGSLLYVNYDLYEQIEDKILEILVFN